MRNGEYAILKAFAEVEDSPGVPGLDIPGIVFPARGYGCQAARPAPWTCRDPKLPPLRGTRRRYWKSQ